MEIDEMKDLWKNVGEKPLDLEGLSRHTLSSISQLRYNEWAHLFKAGEVVGFLIAYILVGVILYKFEVLDTWYLGICGAIVVIYLLVMPLYTLMGMWRLRKIDLVQSSFKEVMENFYIVKSRVKRAEKISLLASPLLFIAAIVLLTKMIVGIDLFTSTFQIPIVLLMILSFTTAILFNKWAFKKRDKQIQSIEQLLEEDN